MKSQFRDFTAELLVTRGYSMSFEGTAFKICKNGHMWSHEIYQAPNPGESLHNCPYCDSPAVWQYVRDDTNGVGEDPMYFVERQRESINCPHCGHAAKEPARVHPVGAGWFHV